MKDLEISEMRVFEAVQVKDNAFFCKQESAIGEKGECGKGCINYIPRNGKSGICKYHGGLYEAGKEVTIKIK